jgi:hypothetical protein
MAKKFKLVQFLYGKPITGELLKEMLIADGFKVPVKQPLIYPEKPVRPTSNPIGSIEAINEWNAYSVAFLIYKNALAAAKLDYFKQFTDFALELSVKFKIVDSVTMKQVGGYTYKQAASKLMGQYGAAPVNGIDFICFQNFG